MRNFILFLGVFFAGLPGPSTRLSGQAIGRSPAPGSRPGAVSYQGLVPGVTPVSELTRRLGQPTHQGGWYDWKMLYKVGADSFDAFHLFGGRKEGKIGTIEAVTIPKGYESAEKIQRLLGQPEFELVLPGGQRLLDYSQQGVRFTLSPQLRTIGAAFFPHGYRRVPPGYRSRLDLGRLRQGPQKRPAAPPDPDMLVGAFELDISPTKADWLKGQYRIHDPLKARCAVIARGGLKIAIVGADLFGLLKSEVDPIELRLRKLGVSHLLLAMSHNHAAPDTIGIYGNYPKEYVAYLQARIVEGVSGALARLAPAKELLVGSDELSLAGARVGGLFRNARNPGIVDPQVAVIQARGEAGQPLVTLVQFACHVEGLEKGPKEISADFPGYLCDELRRRSGAPAIFLNGAIGGMISGDTIARTHKQASWAGLRLADEVTRILAFSVPSASAELSLTRSRVEIPVTNPRMLLFERLHKDRQVFERGRAASELFHVRLGDAELLTIPGELFPELAFELLEKMKGYPRMIVGLCNDELGYMIPAEDFRKGAYEESMSLGPAAGPVIRRRALELLAGERR